MKDVVQDIIGEYAKSNISVFKDERILVIDFKVSKPMSWYQFEIFKKLSEALDVSDWKVGTTTVNEDKFHLTLENPNEG